MEWGWFCQTVIAVGGVQPNNRINTDLLPLRFFEVTLPAKLTLSVSSFAGPQAGYAEGVSLPKSTP
jgi:hypothetical protein